MFVRYKKDQFRDEVVEKINSKEGIKWVHYGVRVKGYSLEAQIKLIKVMGFSPETTAEEIKRSFVEQQCGEVREC